MRNPLYQTKKIAVGGLLLGAVFLFSLASCESVTNAIFEANCDSSLPPMTVEVVTLPIEFTLDNRTSIADLTRTYPPEGTGRVLGITRANLTKDLSIDNTGLVQPRTGRLCTRPQVKVVLSFTPMQVLVASDFLIDSCKYHEVYLHEMRHVDAYAEFLPLVAAEVQKQLTDALGDRVHYFTDAAEGQQTLDTLLSALWMPYLTEKMAQVEHAQANIDTPEEYDRLAQICQN